MADIDDDDLTEDKKTSTFLQKTFNMVSDPSNHHIVCWNEIGDEFVVKNEHDFASILLPLHFRHKNFSSFVRQLNFYGFRKRTSATQHSHFKHPNFRRDRRDLLQHIKRKVTESTSQSSQVKDVVEGLQQQVATLQRQYEDIWKVQHHILFVLSRYMSQEGADPRLPSQPYTSNPCIEHIKDFPDSQTSTSSFPNALPSTFPALPLIPGKQEGRPVKRPHTNQFQYGSGQQYTMLPTRTPYYSTPKGKARTDKDLSMPGAIQWSDWETVQSMVQALPPPPSVRLQGGTLPDSLNLGIEAVPTTGPTTRSSRRRSVATIEEIEPADDDLQPLPTALMPVYREGLGSSATTPASTAMQAGSIQAEYGGNYPLAMSMDMTGMNMAVGASPANYPHLMGSHMLGRNALPAVNLLDSGLLPPTSPASAPLAPPSLTFMPSDLMPAMPTGLITHEPDTLAPTTAPMLTHSLNMPLSAVPRRAPAGDGALMSPLLPTGTHAQAQSSSAAASTHTALTSFPYPTISPSLPAINAQHLQPSSFDLHSSSSSSSSSSSMHGLGLTFDGVSAQLDTSPQSLLPCLAPGPLTTSLTALEHSLREGHN